MIKPAIHINGTHPEELYRQYSEALAAIRSAMKKLEDAAPNGRDYYPLGSGALSEAECDHIKRLERLSGIKQELNCLLAHVADHL